MDSSDKPFDPHALLPKEHPLHPEYKAPQAETEAEAKAPELPPVVPPSPLIQKSTTVTIQTPIQEPVHQPTHTVKKSKKPLVGLLALVLILMLGVGGFYLFQNGYLGGFSVLSPLGPLSPLGIVNEQTLSVGSPQTWQTYVSSQSGFSLRHPATVVPTVLNEKDQPVTVFMLIGPTQKRNTAFKDGISLQIMTGALGETTLEDFTKQNEAALSEQTKITKATAPITINGITGYTYSVSGNGDVTFIYLQNGSSYLKIADLTKDPGSLGYATIVSEMLKTFRFTAQSTPEVSVTP